MLAYLSSAGAASRAELTQKCFNKHIKAADLSAALEFLQLQTPPAIRVWDEAVPESSRGKRQLVCLTSHNFAEVRNAGARINTVTSLGSLSSEELSGREPENNDLQDIEPDLAAGGEI